MNSVMFLGILCALGAIYFVLGWWASRGVATTQDLFLAGRSLNVWQVTITLIATQVGGGLLLGTAGEAYATGYYGMLYALGIVLGMFILGMGFAGKMREFNIATMPELFSVRYNSPGLRRIASLLSAASLCGITAGLVISSRALLGGLGIQSEGIIFAFWLVIIVYTMMGGLRAIVANDILQVMIIIAVFSSIFIYSLMHEPLSFFNVKNLIHQQALFSSGRWNISSYFLMPLCFSLIEQDLAQAFFAARTKRIALVSAVAAGLSILSIALIPVYFGMKARLLGLAVPVGASPLIAMLRATTNDVVIACVVYAVMAAIISTAHCLMCAIGSLLAQDFDIKFAQQKDQLLFSKVIIGVTGVMSLVIAYFFDNILDLMSQSYELTVGCLFVPIVMCYITDRSLTRIAAYGAFIGGFIAFVLLRIYTFPISREIGIMSFSLLGYIVGWNMAKKIEQT